MADPLINKLGTRLKYIQMQQQLLLKNLANVDTPEYKAVTLAPLAETKNFKTTLAKTDRQHIRPKKIGGMEAGFEEILMPNQSEKPSGNTVDEVQHTQLLNESDIELTTVANTLGQVAKLYRMILTGK